MVLLVVASSWLTVGLFAAQEHSRERDAVPVKVKQSPAARSLLSTPGYTRITPVGGQQLPESNRPFADAGDIDELEEDAEMYDAAPEADLRDYAEHAPFTPGGRRYARRSGNMTDDEHEIEGGGGYNIGSSYPRHYPPAAATVATSGLQHYHRGALRPTHRSSQTPDPLSFSEEMIALVTKEQAGDDKLVKKYQKMTRQEWAAEGDKILGDFRKLADEFQKNMSSKQENMKKLLAGCEAHQKKQQDFQEGRLSISYGPSRPAESRWLQESTKRKRTFWRRCTTSPE